MPFSLMVVPKCSITSSSGFGVLPTMASSLVILTSSISFVSLKLRTSFSSSVIPLAFTPVSRESKKDAIFKTEGSVILSRLTPTKS